MSTDQDVLFEPVSSSLDMAGLEDGILEDWKSAHTVEQAFAENAQRAESFVFYEGPPTANGKPGIHHVSARAVKDLYCRYNFMKGYAVDRRAGWDTHGLPVEVQVEKQIGSTGKKDIEAYGVAEFNKLCRESVFTHIGDWKQLTERMGFWVDFDRAYITYKNEYIETEWWILKNFWERGLLTQNFKTTMHCPRCNTSLSDHEVSQGMKEDVDDPSIYVKFRADTESLVGKGVIDATETRPVFFVIWTTTPWTIAANVAIALAGDATYVLAQQLDEDGSPVDPDELLIVAEALLDSVFGEERWRVVRKASAQELTGATYQPCLEGRVESEGTSNIVLIDEIVEISDGTGLVHIAPAYGDLEIGQRHGLALNHSVDPDGTVVPEVRVPGSAEPAEFVSMFFKTADKQIIKHLKQRGLMLRSGRVSHAYPHCWRDDSPLLFLAKSAWYVRTSALKDRLVSNNKKINWHPQHVRDGRFGRWLEGNIDWALSRERYWGTPLPIWQTEDGDSLCIGSVAELSELVGRDLTDLDLHRPYVDDITFEKDGKTWHRTPETVDVWFDSGAMPYAQWHYPFENQAAFEGQFPADYICEGMDQTRGWFYSLHAIGTLLTFEGNDEVPAGPLAHLGGDQGAFKNVVSLGLVNDAENKKMSKSRGNIVDPWAMIAKYGVDPLRWYFLTTPHGANTPFSEADLSLVLRSTFLPLWNVYSFFVTYANIDKPDLSAAAAAARPMASRPEIDRWLDAKCQKLITTVTDAMDRYEVSTAIKAMDQFVDRELSNWYVRRCRERFWGRTGAEDAACAYLTLYDVLVTMAKLIAPIAPFFSESLYGNLTKDQTDAAASVHMADWPTARGGVVEQDLIDAMEVVLRISSLGRTARTKAGVKIRQPLARLLVRVAQPSERAVIEKYKAIIQEELNINAIEFIAREDESAYFSYSLRPNLPVVGKRLGKRIPLIRQQLADPAVVQKAVAAILAEQPVMIELDGVEETFTADDFLLDVESGGDFAATNDADYFVALDLELTPALIEEGRVRELIRHVQELRKKAGLAITDRITLGIGIGDLFDLNDTVRARLSEALLAPTIQTDEVPDALTREIVQIDETDVVVTLAKST